MKDLFKEVLDIEGVHGVVILSEEGALLFSKFKPEQEPDEKKIKSLDLNLLAGALSDIAETEIIFDSGRCYIRKSGAGFLMVFLDDHAPVSMVRLNCEVLIPALEKARFSKSIGQFFRKKIF